MQSINPATGQVVHTYEEHTAEQVEEILAGAEQAFGQWKTTAMETRSRLMNTLQKKLTDNRAMLASMITSEMGKPLRESLAEVDKCALVCSWYAAHGPSMIENEVVSTESAEAYVSYQPLGVVLAVMPWNFPFWQVFRFLAPALMAGNVGVLKHASNVPGCALAIEQMVGEAGFPPDVFRTLLIGSKEVGRVIEDPRVKAVTLTGSTPAGKAIASAAGAVLKKTVLELGGSDPYLVMEDADLMQAAELCVRSRLLNAGQSCISAKRFIIHSRVYEAFKEEFVRLMAQARWGDPTDERSDIGPLARPELRDELHRQVQESVQMGARLLLGGVIPQGEGAFYPPTVLENVQPGMPAHVEELFGPVAVLFSFESEEEALALANDTPFGLGAAVFTRDIGRAKQLAEKGLEAGCVFVNDYVKSDPRLPFGGIKESGYGRELSAIGMREFMNIKSVVVG
ncbi:MAG TPA: NAD-dependent succinate-semialdehyde dehydrogenase [Prolixibacteraceae bacterium]|nr:NAD-dependent succinate-semialdehyde dehydrogenase [Prolixibacteraceae bacterium]